MYCDLCGQRHAAFPSLSIHSRAKQHPPQAVTHQSTTYDLGIKNIETPSDETEDPGPTKSAVTTARQKQALSIQQPKSADTRRRITISEDAWTTSSERLRSPSSTSNTPVRNVINDYMNNPFIHRHGRRFLRDPTSPYPLPVDLDELHRQSLRTIMLLNIYGSPICSPSFDDIPPTKVLEIGCGSALWSSACHDYFSRQGHSRISFTGLDIAPLAPDLTKQGLRWRFVQHDLRRSPLPFKDGEFDLVFIKDAGLAKTLPVVNGNPFTESLRVLKTGGTIELWESDHVFRSLLPCPTMPPGTPEDDVEQAVDTATYIISPSTAFAKAQNKYLLDYNTWVERAFDRRGLIIAPCSLAGWTLSAEPDLWYDLGSRRIAIPFGDVRWEQEGEGSAQPPVKVQSHRPSSQKAEMRANLRGKHLTAPQAALRRSALSTTVRFIEGLEPLLKTESGKRQDEWDRWWASMMHDLLEANGTLNGECLEVGAWWGRKS